MSCLGERRSARHEEVDAFEVAAFDLNVRGPVDVRALHDAVVAKGTIRDEQSSLSADAYVTANDCVREVEDADVVDGRESRLRDDTDRSGRA